jgi:predicted ATPase
MIRRIEALSYRCLRDVSQEIGPFQILVGPNASGKSTFLDVVALLGDLLNNGLVKAVRDRAPDLRSLLWMHEEKRVELAVEFEIPAERRKRLPKNGYERTRYEVAIGLDTKGELAILEEALWLRPSQPPSTPPQRDLFPTVRHRRRVTLFADSTTGWKKVVTKRIGSANDYFMAETTGWNNPFRLGTQRLAFANLPEDEERFPVATWLKHTLTEGIQRLVLNSAAMRRPSPPGTPRAFQADGSNLPWAVQDLIESDPERFERWVEHVRTALPDIEAIETIERPEDKHRYLRITYRTGLKAPSWAVSDGTLRLLALTLVAYLPARDRIYLIEEPENGIHPQAIETVMQSLSAAYDCQILCATHSPVILSLADPDQVLCFARTSEGVADIVRGSEHPQLKEWRRTTDLGTLFATGVLG